MYPIDIYFFLVTLSVWTIVPLALLRMEAGGPVVWGVAASIGALEAMIGHGVYLYAAGSAEWGIREEVVHNPLLNIEAIAEKAILNIVIITAVILFGLAAERGWRFAASHSFR